MVQQYQRILEALSGWCMQRRLQLYKRIAETLSGVCMQASLGRSHCNRFDGRGGNTASPGWANSAGRNHNLRDYGSRTGEL